MDNNWTYYEYADDLIARKAADSRGSFEIFVGGKWELRRDILRFSYTAQKIDDPAAYAREHPDLKAAFDGGVSNRIAKASDKIDGPRLP